VRMLACTMVTFTFLQPYAVIDAYRFVVGVGTEVAMANRWVDYPYTRQYIGTLPFLYPLRQLLLFAMGVPLTVCGLGGVLSWARCGAQALWSAIRSGMLEDGFKRDLVIWMIWPAVYGVSQAAAAVKFVRYQLPLLPFLCLGGAAWWTTTWARAAGSAPRRWLLAVLLIAVVAGTVINAVAFVAIYAQPHTWLQASEWLCSQMPEGATVISEVWDDPLPVLGNRGEGGCEKQLASRRVNVYELEDDARLAELIGDISASDAIVLSSDRLYSPVMRLAERYPRASRYYRALFSGELGYELAFAPAVYPTVAGITLADNPRAGLTLPVPALLAQRTGSRLVLDLGRADESFTVYDHPQPLIFLKVRTVTPELVERLLQEPWRR
jgi:hypothetical protein